MWPLVSALLLVGSSFASSVEAEPAATFTSVEASPEQRLAYALELGRLRDKGSLNALTSLLSDPDPNVRKTAASSLGWIPGSVGLIRERLDSMSIPPATPWKLARAPELAPKLLVALGYQGETQDLPLLARWLDSPADSALGSLQAIERMARREVSGVEELLPLLHNQLWRGVPSLMEQAAICVRRVGVSRDQARPFIEAAWRHPSARVRAELVSASWSEMSPGERLQWIERVKEEADSRVVVAVLRSIRAGDVESAALDFGLKSSDRGIRDETIRALGRVGGEGAILSLRAHLADSKLGEYVETTLALNAAGARLPDFSESSGFEEEIQAALVTTVSDQKTLLDLALRADLKPMVRTAAALRLEYDSETTAALLSSSDPVIREVGVSLIGQQPGDVSFKVLREFLDGEQSIEPFSAAVNLLARGGEDVSDLLETARIRFPEGHLGTNENRVKKVVARLERPQSLESRSLVLVTSVGDFRIELYRSLAPDTVDQVIKLAEDGFYAGIKVHRHVAGFVVQAGCPRGDGWGGPGIMVRDEVSSLPFEFGSVGMARSDRNTNGSQFFVTLDNHPHLVGEYTQFGRVVQGLDVVRRLSAGDRLIEVRVE